ncbi:MAG: hypothetical protein A3F67_05060 [Verrucomicrobia bacterium RIFCSPHIGHO2_12_FULL_41_10]|nr:MAG: hypothetical protein A3F67_05060 [Verrucomicrobia bacterium RIFCSPHIGHO2_12_FULL_41_10]HLB33471.1 hypothetical protein [Chthoniobacterales bacterium]
MKKIFLIITVLILSLFQLAACEVIKKSIKTENETEEDFIPFLKTNKGDEIPLPSHIAYISVESNQNKTIWGINFHGVSNYNGVDLVICNRDKPIIIKNLFDHLEDQLENQKIIPKYSWDNQTLKVKNISSNTLVCVFYGVSFAKQQEISRTFRVLVKIASNKVLFKILAKK